MTDDAIKKMGRMYKLFGHANNPEAICRNCRNLCTYTAERKYYKCAVYGDSRSDATDWRIGWLACGMYNKAYSGNPVIETVKRSGRKKPEEQVTGQMCLELQ